MKLLTHTMSTSIFPFKLREILQDKQGTNILNVLSSYISK